VRALRIGESVEVGGDVGGLGRADLLEDLQCLPHHACCLTGVAGGQSAPAQAGERVSLVPRAGDSSSQLQGLPVAPFSLREFAADPVQRPSLVERLGLAAPVADVAVDAQGLLQGLGRGRVITGQPPHGPDVEEGVGLASPVPYVAVDAQGLLQGLSGGRVITGQPPHVP
jgi:hypothetical protein